MCHEDGSSGFFFQLAENHIRDRAVSLRNDSIGNTTQKPGADKSLARPGRKQATATKL